MWIYCIVWQILLVLFFTEEHSLQKNLAFKKDAHFAGFTFQQVLYVCFFSCWQSHGTENPSIVFMEMFHKDASVFFFQKGDASFPCRFMLYVVSIIRYDVPGILQFILLVFVKCLMRSSPCKAQKMRDNIPFIATMQNFSLDSRILSQWSNFLIMNDTMPILDQFCIIFTRVNRAIGGDGRFTSFFPSYVNHQISGR